jgi:hypothetical protein
LSAGDLLALILILARVLYLLVSKYCAAEKGRAEKGR